MFFFPIKIELNPDIALLDHIHDHIVAPFQEYMPKNYKNKNQFLCFCIKV